MFEDRVIMTNEYDDNEDNKIEFTLRPDNFSEYIGQDKVKENLKVFIDASLKRSESLDHVLLYGPPGLGKTTLASIIAKELGVSIKITSGPAITKAGDLAAMLTNLQPNDILFIDEIHRMNKTVEEVLYPALEDFALDIMIGKGPSARSIRLDIPRFTLIGATTKIGNLSAPLRDRFGIINRLELYDAKDLSKIIKRSANLLEAKIDEESALEIGSRSRGTPRIANRLIKRVRDYAESKNTEINLDLTRYALDKLEIDELGLDKIDIELLKSMATKFGGGPVGLETLAASINEDKDTIEDVYEPYLKQIGFMTRTPRGRTLTKLAYEHLGIKYE